MVVFHVSIFILVPILLCVPVAKLENPNLFAVGNRFGFFVSLYEMV